MPAERRNAVKRGCLHKLVVCNFKSYAGQLTIGPFKDFTCVIGPNGSGKSNLMDAVSFVVGVNTAALRGTKLADFRSNLESATEEPTSVTLYYHAPQKDGSVEEIRFTRTITVRDTSEYRVDSKKVDEKEYQKKLMSVGLLVKSRNFLVFQNEVEAVAQKSPKQLTELLERISGSEDIKKEYDDLAEEKTISSQASVAVYKRSLLVTNEKKQVTEQVKEAKTYQSLLDQEVEMRTKKYLFDLFHIERQLAESADEADKHSEKLVECEKDVKAVSKAVDKQSKIKAEKQKEWAAADKSVEDLEKQIKKIQHKDVFKFDSELKSRKADLENLEKEVENAGKKLKEIKKVAEEDQRNLDQLNRSYKEEEARGQSKDIKLGKEHMSKYSQLAQQAKVQNYKAKEAIEKANLAHQGDLRELQKEEGELTRLEAKRKAAVAKADESKALKEKHDAKFQELGEQKHKLVSEITDLDKKLSNDLANKKSLSEKREDFMSKIGDAKATEKASKREEQFKERLEYLCQSFPGVRGRIMDLCKVRQRQYELAITVVMENNMDAVVVDREETVKRCVEHLRDKKAPPMTFLPLDTISAKPPDERLRMIPGAKLALDVIDYDKAVEKAMWYVTGNAVIVQNLEDAKKLAYSQQSTHVKCKVVTLDACVISKSGALTGGDITQLMSKSQRWQQQDKDVQKLREKFEENERELQALAQSVHTEEGAIRSLNQKKISVETNLTNEKKLRDAAEAELKISTREVDVYTKQIAAQQPKVEKLRATVEAKLAELEKEQAAMAKINKEIFKDFCKELNISNIEEFEGTTKEQQRKHMEDLMSLSSTIEKLKHKMKKQEASEDALKLSIERWSGEKEKLEKETVELRGKEKKSKEAIKAAMDAKAEEVRKRSAIKAEIDEQDVQLKNVQGVLKIKSDERDAVLKLVEKVESNMERVDAQRKSVLEQCELEELVLPRKGSGKSAEGGAGGDAEGGAGGDEMEVDDEGGQMASQASQPSQSQKATQARQDITGASLDYSSLKRELKRNMSEKERQRCYAEMEEERKQLNDTIASMNPNMKAIEQLKEVQDRYDKAQEEMREAKQRAQDVTKRYEEAKAKRCDLFNSCFEHVKSHIDGIYKELTSDPTKVEQSVGGSAYLTLNNQEEPYLDGIKYDTIPPGKRFMDMTHLSGGEKTVAALALLFAINSYFPAPFIVLDEVDAALDARNVAKVTRYIQSRRREQQCIIISLKERFYEKADGLVGICRDSLAGHSKVFTLNLSQFEAVL